MKFFIDTAKDLEEVDPKDVKKEKTKAAKAASATSATAKKENLNNTLVMHTPKPIKTIFFGT